MSAGIRDAVCEKLADGFLFTEGPLWNAQDSCLLFTDIPGNRIHRWSDLTGVTTLREPSNMANGLAADRQGRLIACEHATSRVTRTERDGRITVLASHYAGKELNSPNDAVVRSDGAVYFTDPGYGRIDFYGVPRPPQLAFRGVYRIGPQAESLTLLADDFKQPNGLCFSIDETRLFVNDTERGHIRVFDVAVDGTLAGGKVWAEISGNGPGAPDGMKVDRHDNLYCTGPGGIHMFDRDARWLGVIHVPEVAANFTFDTEQRTMFITATRSLYRVKLGGISSVRA